MHNSRLIASIIGPILVVAVGTEMLSFDIWEGVHPGQVFFNGMIWFSGGLLIVRFHPRWTRDWRSLVTVVGWLMLLAGLFRMLVPMGPQAAPGASTYAVMGIMIAIGAFLTFKRYWPHEGDKA